LKGQEARYRMLDDSYWILDVGYRQVNGRPVGSRDVFRVACLKVQNYSPEVNYCWRDHKNLCCINFTTYQ
jgi:hypothetical protein